MQQGVNGLRVEGRGRQDTGIEWMYIFLSCITTVNGADEVNRSVN